MQRKQTDFSHSLERIFRWTGFLLNLMLLLGCGNQKTHTSPASANQTGSPSSATTIRLAGLIFSEDQFFHLIKLGMMSAAQDAGVELMLENTNNRPDREIALINTYLSQHVDALVISPMSFRGSFTALKRARESGAKIITYNTDVSGDLATAFIESDQFLLGASTGRVAREFIEHERGGKARIALLAFKTAQAETSIQRVDGFKSEVSALPGVEIIAEQDAWLSDAAVKKAGDIIMAHPDLDLIWAANEGGTLGAVMAVKNAGKAGQIAVFGTDANQQLADQLLSDDDTLQAITSQQPYEIGKMAVEAAIKVVHGETVPRKTSLPGVLLSRKEQDKVRAFKNRLNELLQ